MKKLLLALFLISGAAFAQDMTVINGNFDFLKDQTEINTEFDYSNFTMMKEKKSEAQYVEEHKADLDQKAKGNGNLWQKKWVAAKEQIWTPKFLEIGNIVPMTNEDGERMHGQVVEVKDDVVVMNFNHPLAGKEMHFEGSILSIRPATDEEISHGHVHGEGGHHH